MLAIGIVVSVIVAGVVAALQLMEEPLPRARRNMLLVVTSLVLGGVAAGLAIAFDEAGQWGNWEYNVPWILGLSSFVLASVILWPRRSELVIVWWSAALSFLTAYGTWEAGPGDDGMGALLTVIMSAGCIVALVVLILAFLVVNLADRGTARSRPSKHLQ